MEISELYSSKARLATFTRWPFPSTSTCNARAMAEAGFYSCASETGDDADSAKCFLCGKELDGWEATDDPREEHRAHAKHCAFIQLDKREDDLLTVDLLSIVKQYMSNEVKRLAEKCKMELDEKMKRVARKCFKKK